MNSTNSTYPSNKMTQEKSNTLDIDGSSVNKNSRSIISDKPMPRKNSSAEKKEEERKQHNSAYLNTSNTAKLTSPIKRKQSVSKKTKKRRVMFNKNYLDVVYVESYKRYNIDVSSNGPEQNENVRCRCSIF